VELRSDRVAEVLSADGGVLPLIPANVGPLAAAATSRRHAALGRRSGRPTGDEPGSDDSFVAARDATIAALIAFFTDGSLAPRCMVEEKLFLAFTCILELHAEQDLDDRGSWLTLGRLQDVVTSRRLVSRNTVEALVASLIKYGFLERQPMPSDRRIRILVPTAKMRASMRVFLAAHRPLVASRAASALAAGLPGRSPARDIEHAFSTRLPEFMAMRRRHVEARHLLDRDAGYLIFLLLLQSASGPDRLTAAMPYGEIARIARVSRTHVRLVLERAQRQGLLVLRSPGGKDIELTPRLWRVANRWFADHMQFFAGSPVFPPPTRSTA